MSEILVDIEGSCCVASKFKDDRVAELLRVVERDRL